MRSSEATTGSNVLMIAAPIACLVSLTVTCFFNFISAQDLDWGILNNTVGELSDKYYIEITPAGWTFSIWGFIYTYQVILLVYWLTLVCRKNPTTGEPLYRSPVFMSPWISFFYIMNLALNTGWIFAWDSEKTTESFVLLFLISVTLYICMGISFYGLSSNKDIMLKQGLTTEIRLVIGIVHNGFGIYATWTTIATLLNLAIFLTYNEGVDQHIASTISLSVLALEIVAFAFIDNIYLEKHTRYLYTPYIVLHLALIGSIDKNWDSSNSNSIFTADLLAIGAFATLMKIILSVYRTKKDPLYATNRESRTGTVKPTLP